MAQTKCDYQGVGCSALSQSISESLSDSAPKSMLPLLSKGPSTWGPPITSPIPSRRRSLRRGSGRPCAEVISEPSGPYVLGDLTIDYARRSGTLAGQPVNLTPTEYRLLAELSANAGRLLTYERLLDRVWEKRERDGGVQPIRTIVRRLRRKPGDDADNPTYIFTEPRVGYRMPEGETQKRQDNRAKKG